MKSFNYDLILLKVVSANYLNRCAASSMYVLYQPNEQKWADNQLLHLFIFKKGVCQKSASFLQAKLCLWNLQRENWGKPAFIQLSNCMTYWNSKTNPTSQNYYPFYWKMKSSKQVYFINIRLLSRVLCRNRFYSFIKNNIWPMLRHWQMPFK